MAGPADAPAVVYVHGGPGYNSWGFQRAVGPALERSLRMVYVDQRGCGRSNGGPPTLALGMDPTVEDLERLRTHLDIARWSVMGHSFGGFVALVYVTRHPEVVDRVVLVEATGDPEAALAHQVEILAEGGSPTIVAVAHDQRPALDRMMYLYQMLGRAEVSRRLHWANPDAQRRAEMVDQVSLLSDCSRDGVLPAYRAGGWIAPHPELMQRLTQPSLYIAGRQSHVLPPERIQADAAAWGSQLVWLENSGHFPFAEEPERFVEAVVAFLAPPAQ